jgi:16S rRNA processing protein RimM
LKSSNRPDDLVRIGKITGAHGIQGAVKVYSYADSIASFDLLDDLILIDTAGCELLLQVAWVKPYKNGVRLAFKEINSRSQAEDLAGCVIFIPKKSLPELDDETFYWDDLIGMAVYTTDGEHLGRITQIIPTGANDVYVVKTPTGYPVDEILLPAIATVIIEVDVANQRMQVQIPEGLIQG